MKIMNSTWLVSLMAAGSLMLAPQVNAQETNELLTPPNIPSKPAATSEPATAVGNEPTVRETARSYSRPMPMVLFGQDAELKADDAAEVVVVIGGSAKVYGKVKNAVVVIGGQADVDGSVGDAVVGIMGDVHLNPGAKVHRDVVAVMGNVSVAPGVTVGGNAVSVCGNLHVADGAIVHGQKTSVGLPIPFIHGDELAKWLKYCAFELRPLAPQVRFVWLIAGVFFLIYLFIAAVFPHPVQVCVDTLSRRPATTFLIGVLTKLLIPLVILILMITGVGLLVIPFIMTALFVGAAFGKVAIMEWIGLRIGKQFGGGFQKPLVAFLVGTAVITLFYLVPVLGLLTYIILALWGLGCAVTAVFSGVRREAPEKAKPQPPIQETPPAPAPAAITPTEFVSAPGEHTGVPPVWPASVVPEASGPQGAPTENAPPTRSAAATPPIAPPGSPEKLSYPKAGFWERMGAALLDVIIMIILGIIVARFLGRPPFVFITALVYFTAFWAWKGTTPGGVILKLQVVRADGGPLTFVVALVRALAAAVSIVVLFLGFLWITWDQDKEGWHDKIAGTQVVRVPRSCTAGVPLNARFLFA